MRVWPEGAQLVRAESIGAACAACGAAFRVHENLGGYRMRCADCGAWIDVPVTMRPTRLSRQVAALGFVHPVRSPWPAAPPHAIASAAPRALPAAPPPIPRAIVARSKAAPRTGGGGLDGAALADVALMLAALLTPLLVAFAFLGAGAPGVGAAGHDGWSAIAPFAALIGSIGVVLVGLSSRECRVEGLAAPQRPFAHFVEAAAGAGVYLALALWLAMALEAGGGPPFDHAHVRELLGAFGFTATLAVAAFGSALFGELAFRGLLQGRLASIVGRGFAIAASAAFFGLAYGIGPATPILVAMGVHLGWLRERSGSLAPGLLMHLFFAAGLVWATAQGLASL